MKTFIVASTENFGGLCFYKVFLNWHLQYVGTIAVSLILHKKCSIEAGFFFWLKNRIFGANERPKSKPETVFMAAVLDWT